MDDEVRPKPNSNPPPTPNHILRVMIAILLALLALGYTAAVLAGDIAPNRQLSATHLILLIITGCAIGVIVWPEALKAISSLSAGGVRLELRAVQDTQKELAKRQEEQLQFLQEIFPLLLPDNVLKHLQNLQACERGRNVPAYFGSDPVREELRRLRYMHLVEVAPPHRGIGDIPNGQFTLPEYVRLTNRGVHWIERAQELENLRSQTGSL